MLLKYFAMDYNRRRLFDDPLPIQGVRSACEKSRKCYLQVMKKVLKELAGRRLPHHQKVFQEVTTGLLAYMLKLWRTHLEEGVALVARNEAQAARGTLELSHVCLKSEWVELGQGLE